MKLFIFDIKAGPGANNANVTIKDTTIPYAFAGSMLNATLTAISIIRMTLSIFRM